MRSSASALLSFKTFTLVLALVWAGLAHGQGLHISGTVGHDFSRGGFPLYDANMLIGENWGIRYSYFPDFILYQSFDHLSSSGLASYKAGGDLSFLSAIKTWDFRTYGQRDNMPFGYLTAYGAFGVGRSRIKITETRYSAGAASLTYDETYETVNPTQALASFGLYGGQSIAVVDFRVQYLWGEFSESNILKGEAFSQWGLVLSCGVGF